MSLPLKEIAVADTPDGKLSLRRRGERDWLITIDGRMLMNSFDHHSEAALGRIGCRGLEQKAAPRVLLGGLGMAITLRAMLDTLPASAKVQVAELNPEIVAWCRGPLAELTRSSVDDPRVTVTIGDFADSLRVAAESPARLDAIVIDLYVGPDPATRDGDPLYGARACERAHAALRPGGIFAIWAEAFHESYAARLRGAGFRVAHENPARGSRRFVVYVATKPG
jgi:spermidine synthase